MTFFLHTILLNIQINQQNVCQKQKNLQKASLLNGLFYLPFMAQILRCIAEHSDKYLQRIGMLT